MTDAQPKKSDLGVRVASAVVMIAVAGTALWLGGWVWTAFVALVALGVLWEWRALNLKMADRAVSRFFWLLLGLGYVGLAAVALAAMRWESVGSQWLPIVLGAVIATDVGAYFTGRTFGGPKIAPRISPSKTWSGLIGGALGAALVLFLTDSCIIEFPTTPFDRWRICMDLRMNALGLGTLHYLLLGLVFATVAQTGDFFESWMKRRAGVKDSGGLIPGHGGLFDRLDGLIGVCFVLGSLWLLSRVLQP
jgi:phosphatidate cytidylyltransferase